MLDFEKKENKIKIGSGLLILISWIILIGWRMKNPDINLRNAIIVAGIVTLIGLVGIFGQKLFKRSYKEDEVPSSLTRDEIVKKIREEIPKIKWNNIANERGIECIDKLTLEKQDIYAYRIKMNGAGYDEFIVIINANYPEQDFIFLDKDESEHYIRKRMKSASKGNLEEPDVEESEEGVDSFGKPIRRTKKITHKKEKKEDKPDVE